MLLGHNYEHLLLMEPTYEGSSQVFLPLVSQPIKPWDLEGLRPACPTPSGLCPPSASVLL